MSTDIPLLPEPDSETSSNGRVTLPLTATDESSTPRADALRNRTRLLEAATRLVAEHGASNLTMEGVAQAASVGKGTVFRRFGDRNGLLLALLDHQEKQLQTAFLTGPPPVGPGAPPAERLRAFGPAVLRHEDAHRDLYLAAEPAAERRFTVPARRVRLTHVATLLREAGTDGDVELLAHTLLGYLDTALTRYLLDQLEMSVNRVESGWRDLVTRFVASSSDG
ncbi:transcriptional regulator, TetR family [Actinopolyspora alba]|uniref:Transcriptional regulator, TetR family n=1 Tax=Actinopolyspora alba TaxID=673379 RepID=A0A1I1ZQ42_9ACTN|nr:TetR/AcrR family transcriptional regulator [Actinopolyspora alba]SFE33934.1 transcriptional regulator, TetR family [Actinopolyspora alba]